MKSFGKKKINKDRDIQTLKTDTYQTDIIYDAYTWHRLLLNLIYKKYKLFEGCNLINDGLWVI